MRIFLVGAVRGRLNWLRVAFVRPISRDVRTQLFVVLEPQGTKLVIHPMVAQSIVEDLQAAVELSTHDRMLRVGSAQRAPFVGGVATEMA